MDDNLNNTGDAGLGDAQLQYAANAPEAGSPLSRIRARRARMLKEHRTIMAIPGYGAEMFGEFRALDFDENNAIAKRLRDDKTISEDRATFVGAIDTLIESCTRILIRDPDLYTTDATGEAIPGAFNEETGEGLVPIDLSAGEHAPVRFDQRLCPLLQMPYDEKRGARGILLDVFGGKDGEMPMFRFATRVGMWMNNVTGETDKVTLGESNGTI